MIDEQTFATIRDGVQVQRAEHELLAACASAITPEPDDLSFLLSQEFSKIYGDLAHARLRRALELRKANQ